MSPAQAKLLPSNQRAWDMHFRIKTLGWDMVRELFPFPSDPIEREELLEKLHFLKVTEEKFQTPQPESRGVDRG